MSVPSQEGVSAVAFLVEPKVSEPESVLCEQKQTRKAATESADVDADADADADADTATEASRKTSNQRRKVPVPVFLEVRQALVYETAKYLQWRQVRDVTSRWLVAWVESADPVFYRRMRTGQRVNQFPGMEALSRKKNLARHLNTMRDAYADEYDVYPRTWMLPEQMLQFREEFTGRRNRTFIVKPDARCQGRGIFLTRNIEDIDPRENQVAQRYMHKPFLIDGLKFDLRLYVLLTSVDPLRVYLLKDGLVRFCTERYKSPCQSNLDVAFSHLTNYSINKNNDNFVHNSSVEDTSSGSKWTYQSLENWLVAAGYDISSLWPNICDCIVKAVISAIPQLRHCYRVNFPTDDEGSMCYQLLGVDIMLDYKLQPFLLEFNRNPSLRCDTPLDASVKQQAVRDALQLVCAPRRANRRSSNGSAARLASGSSFRDWKRGQKSRQETQSRKRMLYEAKRAASTAYQRLYPLCEKGPFAADDMQRRATNYDNLLDFSQQQFDNKFRRKNNQSRDGEDSSVAST